MVLLFFILKKNFLEFLMFQNDYHEYEETCELDNSCCQWCSTPKRTSRLIFQLLECKNYKYK